MEFAYNALNQTIFFYLFRILFFGALIACGVFAVVKSSDGGDQMAFFTIGLSIWFFVYLFGSVMPFIKDYYSRDIITIEGIYSNNDNTKGGSSASGIHPVTIKSNGDIIDLTTAPWNDDVFLKGEYEVVAYYVPNAKLLLYIEVKAEK